MDTRPIRTHPLVPPLLIGIISVLGICVILASAFLPRQDAEFVPTRTSTPFKYQFLATETLIPTPTSETAEILPAPTFDIAERDAEITPFFVATEPNEISPEGFFTPVSTITLDPVFGNSAPLLAGIYDDSDPGFTYIGVWDVEESIDAYQGFVLVSNEIGNFAAFSFVGSQITLGYQRSDDAGDLTVDIDGAEETMTQLVGSVWFSYDLEPGIHYVILTHESGGPVNLDYIEVFE